MAPPKRNLAIRSGRPPAARTKPVTISKKATNHTINTYHRLNKALSAAEKAGNHLLAIELRRQITERGGLDSYQKASIQGQATDRGGDSSVVLLQWLRPVFRDGRKVRMLEIGALSTQNACSKAGIFDITRIDLNSQGEGILKQDFMERPLPFSEKDKFDVISLSLVLNFVPSSSGRGEMLKRTCDFLATEAVNSTSGGAAREFFPSLFLVLPAACTTNSRFMNDEQLALIMTSFGYILRHRKQTNKLVYYLWILRDRPDAQTFSKRELNPGAKRNNFSIVLEEG